MPPPAFSKAFKRPAVILAASALVAYALGPNEPSSYPFISPIDAKFSILVFAQCFVVSVNETNIGISIFSFCSSCLCGSKSSTLVITTLLSLTSSESSSSEDSSFSSSDLKNNFLKNLIIPFTISAIVISNIIINPNILIITITIVAPSTANNDTSAQAKNAPIIPPPVFLTKLALSNETSILLIVALNISAVGSELFVIYLTTELLGLNGLMTSIISMLSIAELGVGEAINYSLYTPLAKGDKAQVNAIMKLYKKLYLGIAGVILVIGLAIIPFLHLVIDADITLPFSYIYKIYFLFLFDYDILEAKVINNSLTHSDNYITINKGKKDGVRSEMGVIDGNGVVGIVYLVSDNYSIVIPVLNSKSSISCKVKRSDYFGFLKWDGGSSKFAVVKDMPRHSLFSLGDTIVTSGHSAVFPGGISVGTIEDMMDSQDGLSYQLKVKLFTDFGRLDYVRVIAKKGQEEQMNLEQQLNNEKK